MLICYSGDVSEAVQGAAMPAKDIEEYLEVHIEQVGVQLGVVSTLPTCRIQRNSRGVTQLQYISSHLVGTAVPGAPILDIHSCKVQHDCAQRCWCTSSLILNNHLVVAFCVAMGDTVRYAVAVLSQGPILERVAEPLGVVSGVAGQTRLWATINGTQVCLSVVY